MIFVTVGTIPFPMDRMSVFVERLSRLTKERIVYQHGHSRMPHASPNLTLFGELPYSQFRRYMHDADTIICHGGPATIFQALETGCTPFVIPRLSKFGEHVNDHQVAYAEYLYNKHVIELLRFFGTEDIDQRMFRPHTDRVAAKLPPPALLTYLMMRYPGH